MDLAPTLPTACGSLPPEGTLRLRPGQAGSAAPAGIVLASCSPMRVALEALQAAARETLHLWQVVEGLGLVRE